MLYFTGNYSGLRGLKFEHEATGAGTPFRTGGHTINFNSGYGFCEQVSIRNAFIGILLGTRGGWSTVRDVALEYFADGVTAFGSGGILVQNFGLGPDNYIENVSMITNAQGVPPDTLKMPGFFIKITHSGETHIKNCNCNMMRGGLQIVPGSGQTAQCTRVTDSIFDATQGDSIVIAPTGTGYVFDTQFVNCWITDTQKPGTSGLRIGGGSLRLGRVARSRSCERHGLAAPSPTPPNSRGPAFS